MSAKALLKSHHLSSQASLLSNGYMVSHSGEEIKITKDMIKLACNQLLNRCRK